MELLDFVRRQMKQVNNFVCLYGTSFQGKYFALKEKRVEEGTEHKNYSYKLQKKMGLN